MTVAVAPGARYLIVCDEVLPDSQRPEKLMIVGLTSLVAWPAGGTTPVRLEKLAVLLILTDGRARGWVESSAATRKPGRRCSALRPSAFLSRARTRRGTTP